MLLQLDGDQPSLWQESNIASSISLLALPYAILPAHLFYVERIHAIAGRKTLTFAIAGLAAIPFASATVTSVLYGTYRPRICAADLQRHNPTLI